MISEDYIIKVGDKLIMNELGSSVSYGKNYINDCVSGVIIVEIRPFIDGDKYLYSRTDKKENSTVSGTPWHTTFLGERRKHFDLIWSEPIETKPSKSRLELILDET